jgi:hypothetical protein
VEIMSDREPVLVAEPKRAPDLREGEQLGIGRLGLAHEPLEQIERRLDFIPPAGALPFAPREPGRRPAQLDDVRNGPGVRACHT